MSRSSSTARVRRFRQRKTSVWEETPHYKPGDFIDHPKYGRGTITEVSGLYTTLTLHGKPLHVVPMHVRVLFPGERGLGSWMPNPDFPGIQKRLLPSFLRNQQNQSEKSTYGIYFSPNGRPKGRAFNLHSGVQALRVLYRLYEKHGYPLEAIVSSLPSWGVIQTIQDVWPVPGGVEDYGHGPMLGYEEFLPGYHFERVERPVGPSKTKAAAGRINEKIFMTVLAKTRYDLDMQAALRDTLVKGVAVGVVARQRHVSRRILSEATRRLRKQSLNFG